MLYKGMTLAEWRFSAQRAWQDLFIRWTLCISLVVAFLVSVFVLFRLVPEGMRSGVVTMHYTIYLGIDDVRPWPWVFVFPGVFLTILALNTGIAFGLYRSDQLAARALTGLGAVIITIAAVSSFFLVFINL